MVKLSARKSQPVSRSKSEDTRRAILRAAITEFGEFGPAGARTDSIARAAGVNKALLHYYFGSKEELYATALDQVFAGFLERQLGTLHGEGSIGERVLRYFLSHFEHLAIHGAFARMVEYEMMRARKGHDSHVPRLVESCFGPLSAAIRDAIHEGIQLGEFRPVDPAQFALSMTGANVFYFISTPVIRQITGHDARSPELLQQRKAAILDFCAAALFADREHGLRTAQLVLADFENYKNTQRGKRP